MLTEISTANKSGMLYFSKRFTPAGQEIWPRLLEEAARSYNEHWLAHQLEHRSAFKGFEQITLSTNHYSPRHVPHTSAATLAEGQFNRFYILGLSQRAIQEKRPQVFVSRAKHVEIPREKSESLIGCALDPKQLISALRPVQSSVEHFLVKPNSGITIRL